MLNILTLAVTLHKQSTSLYGAGCHWRVNPKTHEIQVFPTNMENPAWTSPILPYPYVKSFEEWRQRLELEEVVTDEEDPSLDYISLSLKDKHFLVVCLNFYSLYEDGDFRIKDFTDFEPIM